MKCESHQQTTHNQQPAMSEKKARASRLDPYTRELIEMDEKHMTLLQMLKWLEKRGVKMSDTAISHFLRKHRVRREEEHLTLLIMSGAKECREAEKALDRNPAPSLDTLVKIFRVLIMKLVKNESVEPKFLRLADQLARTAIRDRELAMEEAKFAETKKSEQIKALEFCLDEADKFPKVQKKLKTAFNALKKAAGVA